MDLTQALEILKTILVCVIGAFAIYFQKSAAAKEKVADVQRVIASLTAQVIISIRQAEEDYKDVSKAGGQKFEQVVNQAYDLVPDALKPIITKDLISNLVQDTFEQMEMYAKQQLDMIMNKVEIETKEQ